MWPCLSGAALDVVNNLFVPAPSILRVSPSQGRETALLCAQPSPEGGKLSVNIFIFMVTEAAERKALILQAPRPLPSSGDRVVKADPGVPSPTPKLQAAARAAGPREAVGCEAGPHVRRGWPRGCWNCVSQPAGFLPELGGQAGKGGPRDGVRGGERARGWGRERPKVAIWIWSGLAYQGSGGGGLRTSLTAKWFTAKQGLGGQRTFKIQGEHG